TGSTTGTGRSFPLGGAPSGTTTSGPHSSDLSNKADPRIDSDRDGSPGVGATSGFGSGTGATPGSAHQGDLSRSGLGGSSGAETGLATGAATGVPLPKGYGEESWAHDHGKHGHEYAGDPCENQPPVPGAVHFSSGPHSLDTANRLDPNVGGGATSGLEHATMDSTSHTGERHTGSGAVATGVGSSTTSAGAYQSSRGTPSTSTTQQPNTTAGSHKSDFLNKADPRVDSDLSKQRGTTTTSGLGGSGATSNTESITGREHHKGRDAALAGAGVGAGGTSAYGAEPSSTHNVPEGTSGSGYTNPYPPTSSSTGPVSSLPSSTVGSGLASSTTAPKSTTGPSSSTGLTSTLAEPRGINDPSATSDNHHHGRDAGLAGAGAGLGAGAAYQANKHLGSSHGDTTSGHSVDPTTTQQPLSESSRPNYGRGSDLTGAGTTGYHDPGHQPPTASRPTGQPISANDQPSDTGESNTGRNAALGVGVGGAAVAGGEELSRKDLEREQKAAHKQELKEEKHHQHELEKAEKKHEKAAHKQGLKEEKHHQHELEKAEKKHEKALAKEEAKQHHKEESQEGEKKHHGLFGFLHRDKTDKTLNEEEAARNEGLEHPGSGAAGAGVAGVDASMSEKEKHQLAKEHDRNRLHKDPPPGYGETRYAEEPKSGLGDSAAPGSHTTGLGNKADPDVTGRGNTFESDNTRDGQGRTAEPHTGLPGGTDSTPVHGYHPDGSSTTTGTTGGSSTGEGFGHLQDHPR
ncbi:MAG: hypothetical protein Q9171_000295, partial [Xanthocarpia ochracea]